MPISRVQMKPFPELHFHAAEKIMIDLEDFIDNPDEELLHYSISDHPSWISLDSRTGRIEGITPILAVDTPFLIKIVIEKIDSEEVSEDKINEDIQPNAPTSIEAYLAFMVTGTNSQQLATELSEDLVRRLANDEAFEKTLDRWKIIRYVEYIISEHFPILYIYDSTNPPTQFGKILETRKAECGFSIYNFDNCIVISSGDMAFEEYGNKNRMLKAMEEAYRTDLPKYNWHNIGLSSTDLGTLNKSWVVAKLLELPVSNEAPTDSAQASYNQLARLIGDQVSSTKRLVL